MITPTAHEKSEWSRLANAAYSHGLNGIGHKFSGYAALPTGARLDCATFDALQNIYRAWLLSNRLPGAPVEYASRGEAHATLPADADWSSSFGYPGEGGFVEYFRTPAGEQYRVSNGPWDAVRPFAWTVTKTAA